MLRYFNSAIKIKLYVFLNRSSHYYITYQNNSKTMLFQLQLPSKMSLVNSSVHTVYAAYGCHMEEAFALQDHPQHPEHIPP